MPNEILQVYETTKAEVDSQIATAKHFPRNYVAVKKAMILDIVSSKSFAETCCFALPPTSDGKVIAGPSVNLAKLIAQHMGNIRFGARVVEISKTHVTSQGVCIDLEKNVNSTIEVKRSIIGSNGRYSEHMITVTGNAANAIALRNAVFNVVPRALVDEMYEKAKSTVLGKVNTKELFEAKKQEIINKIRDVLGVTNEEICFAMRKERLEFITKPEELSVLSGLVTSITNGDATIDEIFRGKKQTFEEPPKEEDRLIEMMKAVKNKEQLQNLKPRVKTAEQKEFYNAKLKEYEAE